MNTPQYHDTHPRRYGRMRRTWPERDAWHRYPPQPGRRPSMSRSLASLTLIALLAFALPARAGTTIYSANSLPWEVEDDNADRGIIHDGGQDAFDDYGSIRIRVLDASGAILTSDKELGNFGLTHDGGRRWATDPLAFTSTPVEESGMEVSRALFAPAGTDYMRYIDTFTNVSGTTRYVRVAWGGNLGSDECTTVAATSSGDPISNADVWAVTIQAGNPPDACSFDPAGPALDSPVGYALGSPGNGALISIGGYSNPFETPWPGTPYRDVLAYVYSFTLAPGESVSLAYFLYRGLREDEQTKGQEIALARTTVAGLVASPDFDDLTPAAQAAIRNWFRPFQSFTITSAGVTFDANPSREQFNVKGTFTPDPGGNGIDPINEYVAIAVGTAFVTIPPGSFAAGPGGLAFSGPINGVDVSMKIAASGPNTFTFEVAAKKVDLTDTANPVEIILFIGGDVGVTNLRFKGRLSLQ